MHTTLNNWLSLITMLRRFLSPSPAACYYLALTWRPVPICLWNSFKREKKGGICGLSPSNYPLTTDIPRFHTLWPSNQRCLRLLNMRCGTSSCLLPQIQPLIFSLLWHSDCGSSESIIIGINSNTVQLSYAVTIIYFQNTWRRKYLHCR